MGEQNLKYTNNPLLGLLAWFALVNCLFLEPVQQIYSAINRVDGYTGMLSFNAEPCGPYGIHCKLQCS